MSRLKYKDIVTVYEDDDLIIVSKPADVLSIPDRYDPDIPNLYTYLRRKHETILITHRIDKETSGLICFAKITCVCFAFFIVHTNIINGTKIKDS